MSTKRFALFLAAVGLCWLLPLAPRAKAVTTAPLIIQRCGQVTLNANSLAALTCVLSGVTAGNTVIATYYAIYGTSVTFTTATESFTCPAAALVHDTGIRQAASCYVNLASSHSAFTVTLTASGAPPAGGVAQVDELVVREIQGLGSIDSSASGSALGTNPSVSTTTANANEWVDVSCVGFADNIVPTSSSWIQDLWVTPHLTSAQDFMGLSVHQIVGSASTFTSKCTETGSTSADTVTVLAFQQSSPPNVPAVQIVQACSFLFPNPLGGGANCDLHNTVSGNKIVWGGIAIANSGPLTGFACNATETCTCPSNTIASATYAHFYQSFVCASDTASSHSTFSASYSASGPTSFNQFFIMAYEVSGLNSGFDAGSEAGCAAVTCSYTTAANNEWAFFIGGGHPNGTQMLPGNSFQQSNFGNTTADTGANETSQAINAILSSTGASGSKTASYSQTSNAAPLLSVAAFGVPVVAGTGYPMVIKYQVRPRKIPWDRPRRQILLEKI